mmetsp:Transcript_66539/g.98620  ORF Transcript_66539/g.98620 Transcript_66539/m.98620 type:complete len:123 (+) Transcript_66539:1262-1630(+)
MAPRSTRKLIVGMEDTMRVSSVIVVPSRGTFKSQRTRTFFPLYSSSLMSEIDFFPVLQEHKRRPHAWQKEIFQLRGNKFYCSLQIGQNEHQFNKKAKLRILTSWALLLLPRSSRSSRSFLIC